MAVAEYLVANRKDAGMPGPQGPAGPAGVTSARGETLPPGSEVEVSLENRVLTVKVPRGDKGDKGETGATGAQGQKGDTGAQGPQGERGPQGETGAQGPQGVQGPKGDRGDGLQIDYTAASSGELPTSGVTEGQTGIVNGELFVWDGSQWSSQGQMQGAKGDPGVTPNITLTASVDANVGTPSVDVTKSGTPENPMFDIALHNLKGGVNTVSHDDTLTGDGTSGTPLGVANGTAINPFLQTALPFDLNDITADGLYGLSFTGELESQLFNAPAGAYATGKYVRASMLVLNCGFEANAGTTIQVWFNRGGDNGLPGIYMRIHIKDRWTSWRRLAFMSDIPTDYVSDKELSSQLAGYVTDSKLTQGLQAESSEREKQDGLLEESINGKIAASNVKAGDGIGVAVSGNDATVSLNARTIPVTFEASLFKSGLSVRKTVSGLGSVNMISPAADAANVAVIQAAGPVLAQDHGDDASIPEGMVQVTVGVAPTADMDFVITVLRNEA